MDDRFPVFINGRVEGRTTVLPSRRYVTVLGAEHCFMWEAYLCSGIICLQISQWVFLPGDTVLFPSLGLPFALRHRSLCWASTRSITRWLQCGQCSVRLPQWYSWTSSLLSCTASSQNLHSAGSCWLSLVCWCTASTCSFIFDSGMGSSHSGQRTRKRRQWASWRVKWLEATLLLLQDEVGKRGERKAQHLGIEHEALLHT